MQKLPKIKSVSAVCKELLNLPSAIYLLKVNNRNGRTRCEICSNLTIKTPERRQWRRFGVFIINFEHIWHKVPVFLNFEYANADWAIAADRISSLFHVMNQLAEIELAANQKTYVFIPVYDKPKSILSWYIFLIKRLNVIQQFPLNIISLAK